MKGKGKCLCGSVELEVEYVSNELGACHCSMCRNWSGGPMLVIDCADSVKISGRMQDSLNFNGQKTTRNLVPARQGPL